MTTVMSHMQPMGTSTPTIGGPQYNPNSQPISTAMAPDARFANNGFRYNSNAQPAPTAVSFANDLPRYHQIAPMGPGSSSGANESRYIPNREDPNMPEESKFACSLIGMVQGGELGNENSRRAAASHLEQSIAWARGNGQRPTTTVNGDGPRTDFVLSVDNMAETLNDMRKKGLSETDFDAITKEMLREPFHDALTAANMSTNAGPYNEEQLERARRFAEHREHMKTRYPHYHTPGHAFGSTLTPGSQDPQRVYTEADVRRLVANVLSEYQRTQESQPSEPATRTIIMVIQGKDMADSSVPRPFAGSTPSRASIVNLVDQLLASSDVRQATSLAGQRGVAHGTLGPTYGGYQFRQSGRILGDATNDPQADQQTLRNTLRNAANPRNWFGGRSTSGTE
jgi:hypothetical protein